MKIKIFFCFVFLSLLPIIALGGDFPKGTFTSKMGDTEFIITLKSDSSYVIEFPGPFKIVGSYEVSRDTMTAIDFPGDRSCPAPGKYLWHYENEKLTFTVLTDECTGRATVLRAGSWSLKK